MGFVTNASKGLLGAYGIGFLYLSARWRDRLEPAYLSRAAIYQGDDAMSDMGSFDYALAPSSRMFEVGSYNLAGAYAAAASLDLLLGLGAQAIEDRVLGLAAQMRAALGETHFAPLVGQTRDPAAYSHIVTLGVMDAGGHDVSDNPQIMGLSRQFKAAGITHSIRRGQIRMALHAFNSPEDIRRTIAAVTAFSAR